MTDNDRLREALENILNREQQENRFNPARIWTNAKANAAIAATRAYSAARRIQVPDLSQQYKELSQRIHYQTSSLHMDRKTVAIAASAAAVVLAGYIGCQAITQQRPQASAEQKKEITASVPKVIAAIASYSNEDISISISAEEASRLEVYSGLNKIDDITGNNAEIKVPAEAQDLSLKVYDNNNVPISYKLSVLKQETLSFVDEVTETEPARTIETLVIAKPESYSVVLDEKARPELGPLAVVSSIITKGSPIEALIELFPSGKDVMYNEKSDGSVEGIAYKADVDRLPDLVPNKNSNGENQPLHIGDEWDLPPAWVEKYGANAQHIPAVVERKIESISSAYSMTRKPVTETKYELELKKADDKTSSIKEEKTLSSGESKSSISNSIDSRIFQGDLHTYNRNKVSLDDIDLLAFMYEETDMSISRIRQVMTEETGMNWSVGTVYRTLDKVIGKARRRDNSSLQAYEDYIASPNSLQASERKI